MPMGTKAKLGLGALVVGGLVVGGLAAFVGLSQWDFSINLKPKAPESSVSVPPSTAPSTPPVITQPSRAASPPSTPAAAPVTPPATAQPSQSTSPPAPPSTPAAAPVTPPATAQPSQSTSPPAPPSTPAAAPVTPPATAQPSQSTSPPAPPSTTVAPSRGPTVASLPAEAGMSEADRRQVQEALSRLHYYRGPVDGIFGPLTRAAIRGFQHDIGAKITDHLTADEANRLVGTH